MGAIEAKVNDAKREAVAVLEEKVGNAQGLFFADYSGLSVSEINKLRGSFHEAGNVEFLVAKNTLITIALRNKGLPVPENGVLAGPTAIAIGYEDPVTPVKVVAGFAKESVKKKPVFKGAIVEGEVYSADQVKQLADIPPMEQLLASIVGSIASPLSGFVGVLNETVRSFVGVIDAIIQKKQAAGEE